ncbi:A disintegrin and metalloproteinase with thrombospondin motifs adt-1-like [Ruditapes philippinarum]|uniref:A disintegrin and metalloproteinase with thrombospondin motifs adt-1-like n=1 Tax=Ruditapes philippinarum TaxID=129788 RepID=UPI00295ABBDE|nr:A disintegrin and metalloproteinase with thrombospondin motifs adt-1-like [Ruditapes philippinarum]
MNISLLLATLIIISSMHWVDSLLCYSCSDLKSNEECFNTTICPDGEACYGRADGFLTSEVKHTTGCTKELKPQRRNDSLGYSFCAKTCRDNLCNLHSCQLLDNSTKPPRCLACDSVDSPSLCKKVVQCNSNEVCFSERVFTFHNAVYRFGCVKEKDCSAQPVNMAAILGKRADEKSCSVCCKTEHCNINACSNYPVGQMFPLSPISSGICTDSDAALCSTFGRLRADACKEQIVLNRCPSSCGVCAHIVWSQWSPWGSCSASCGLGTRTRSRTCHRRFNFVGTCAGPSTSSSTCQGHNCPVNGGWCVETRQDCHHVYSSYMECTNHRDVTTCSCPAPQNGGLPCKE